MLPPPPAPRTCAWVPHAPLAPLAPLAPRACVPPHPASHFRFASLRWYVDPEKYSNETAASDIVEIKLKVQMAYRRSGVSGSRWIYRGDNNAKGDQYYGNYMNWGDRKYQSVGPLQVTTDPDSPYTDWSDSQAVMTHTYSKAWIAKQDKGWTISVKSCCRVGPLINNAHRYFKFATYGKKESRDARVWCVYCVLGKSQTECLALNVFVGRRAPPMICLYSGFALGLPFWASLSGFPLGLRSRASLHSCCVPEPPPPFRGPLPSILSPAGNSVHVHIISAHPWVTASICSQRGHRASHLPLLTPSVAHPIRFANASARSLGCAHLAPTSNSRFALRPLPSAPRPP